MSVGDPQLAGKLSPIVNIKDFGATCNGSTNDLSALEAAVTAGHKRIFCPSNTLILLNGSGSWAANTIAGGLQIFGEDWTTVVFKSNSVSSTEVYAGAGTELNNVAIYSYRGEVIKTDMPGGVNQARPVRKYANNTNSTRAVQTWYKHDKHIDQGDSAQPDTQGDWPATSIANWGEGDCYWAGALNNSACFRADVQEGIGLFAPLGATYNASSFAYAAHLSTQSAYGYSVNAAAKVLYIEANTDHKSIEIEPKVNTTTDLQIAHLYKTAGQMVHLFHSTSTFNGTGVLMHFASGSGSFGGFFIDCMSNSSHKFTVDYAGNVTKITGSFKIPHPVDEDKVLYHSFIEGPKADLIYRGKVTLKNSSAVVDINKASNMSHGTFEALTQDPQVFLQNDSGWTMVKGSVNGCKLTLTSDPDKGVCNDVISWMVVAERADAQVKEWKLTDDDGHLIPEWPKEDEPVITPPTFTPTESVKMKKRGRRE